MIGGLEIMDRETGKGDLDLTGRLGDGGTERLTGDGGTEGERQTMDYF